MLQTEYPLKKELKNSINFFKPILSFKYSPNDNKDISNFARNIENTEMA